MAASQQQILIEQGSTFKLRIRPTSPTLDFTGATGRGQIRRTFSDPTALATFTSVSGTDVTGFYIDLSLSAAETAAIPVTPASNYQKKDTLYCYDIELLMADGRVIRLLQGIAKISPEVTK